MEFTDQDLSGARYAPLPTARLFHPRIRRDRDGNRRPHLHEGALWVNGVDVVPLVEAEVNRRCPGRELKTATTPDGLRTAWAAVQEVWADVLPTAAGLQDLSVDGEWSFSQTLRHLAMATNVWLPGAVLGSSRSTGSASPTPSTSPTVAT